MTANARAAAATGVTAALLFAACQSAALPERSGEGVVAFDREPPAGAEVFACPRWTEGDRFVYLRAGLVRLPFRVAEASEAGYVLAHEEGLGSTRLTTELAMAGAVDAGDSEPSRVDDPPEALLHWPLWVGKRWSCHFLRKAPGEPAVPLLATYHCDGLEEVAVPAGTFRCLRIWRRVRVAADGPYLERASLLWYAPAVGNFARRLENGTLLDLEEYHRQ